MTLPSYVAETAVEYKQTI